MAKDPLERLKTGDFNHMSQEWQPDGSVLVTLSKRGEGKIYEFRVKDLYGVDEEVLAETIRETKHEKMGA